jgi:hypothetical protein
MKKGIIMGRVTMDKNLQLLPNKLQPPLELTDISSTSDIT